MEKKLTLQLKGTFPPAEGQDCWGTRSWRHSPETHPERKRFYRTQLATDAAILPVRYLCGLGAFPGPLLLAVPLPGHQTP